VKDTTRQPTNLKRLEEVIATLEDDGGDGYTAIEAVVADANAWLQWTHAFLSARKQYHRKHTVKNALLRKMAEQLLSRDELDALDKEAEDKL
jgi:hypothetical protein